MGDSTRDLCNKRKNISIFRNVLIVMLLLVFSVGVAGASELITLAIGLVAVCIILLIGAAILGAF